MATNYDNPFRELIEDLRRTCPLAAAALEDLREQCSAQTAYYAVFVFICLEAMRESHPTPGFAADISLTSLQSFTFFERAKAEPQALDLFSVALECYKHDLGDGAGG